MDLVGSNSSGLGKYSGFLSTAPRFQMMSVPRGMKYCLFRFSSHSVPSTRALCPMDKGRMLPILSTSSSTASV